MPGQHEVERHKAGWHTGVADAAPNGASGEGRTAEPATGAKACMRRE